MTLVERDIVDRLAREDLRATVWSNRPGDRYAVHEHGYDKVIVCVSGGIRFGIPGTTAAIDLAPGDRLELPASTPHDAEVGPVGVTCLEAHAEPGRIAVVARRAAGEW